MEVVSMVLTYNYGDLQDIKNKILETKKLNAEDIYALINSYKDTLNYMYENNLIVNATKEDLENELLEFANKLLSKENLSYKKLDKKYHNKFFTNFFFNPNEINLKIN